MFESGQQRPFFLLETEEKRFYSAFFRQRLRFTVAGLALTALVLGGCKEEIQSQQSVRPVKAVVVHEESGTIVKTYSGNIRARTESALGFRISGKIIERLVDTGDAVKIGQVIARLDDTDLLLSENSARAAVRSAKTRLAVARDALNRAATLQPKGYTPSSVVDQRKLEADAAEAALEAAEAQARQAANATGYAVLKTDKTGIVTAVPAEAGQVVQAGAPVILIAESGGKEVALNVAEQDVAQLAIGQDADLTLWADKAIQAKGTIREIGGQADPDSRTYAVRIAIADAPALMRLGMTATAKLRLGSEAPYLTVPLTALTEIGGRKAVFVADRTTSKVSPRFVETNGVTPDAVKVKSGLTPGDVVVTGGVQFLTEGTQVRLPDSIVQTASTEHSQTR